MGIGETLSDGLGGSGPFGPDAGPTRDRAGCASGLPVIRGRRNQPPAAVPNGNAAGGFGPDAEGMAGMPAGRCSGNWFLGIAKGLWTTRWMPGASCPSANVWRRYGRSGVTPERAPIPSLNGRAFERPARFGPGMAWLAQRRNSRVGPGLLTMVKLSLRCLQGWRLPALHYAVGPRYSNGELAVIRRRQILARCANGRSPRAFRPTGRPWSR